MTDLATALRHLADKADAGEVTGLVVAYEDQGESKWSVLGSFSAGQMMTALRRARVKIIATRMMGPSEAAVRAVPRALE